MIAQYLSYFCPPSCSICARSLLQDEEILFLLCNTCRSRPSPLEEPYCISCGNELISEIKICSNCRTREYFFEKNVTLFRYQDVADILAAYKFNGHWRLAYYFAEQLQLAYWKNYAGLPVIPVPASVKGKRKRGFDQMELIAKILRKKYKITTYKMLERSRSKEQKKLNYHDRLQNLQGHVRLKKHCGSRQIVLLDDIFTSGATLSVYAELLMNNGYSCKTLTIAID